GKTMVTLPRPLGFSAAFSPDGKMLALAGLNGAIDLFRVPSGEYIATLDRYTPSLAPCGIWQHPQRIHSVTFSPDGKTLASASEDGKVILWDVALRRDVVSLEGHSDVVSSVFFSPDNNTLASGSWDKTVKLWKLHPEKKLEK